MSIKEKVKSYSFWVSLASALVLILQVIGSKLGFYVDARLASDIITSVCSILVITGIIVTPTARTSIELIPEKTEKESSDKQSEIISPDNTLKENISILADNLKDAAEKVFEENTNVSENQTTEKQYTLEASPQIEVVDVKANKSQTDDTNSSTDQPIIAEETTEPTITEQAETNTDDNLKIILNEQKEKYADNIEQYYQILLAEIKSLRAHE